MFIRSYNKFRKERINFKFKLVENKLSEKDDDSDNNLILENKEQALNILRKLEIREDNEEFQFLKSEIEKTFSNLNYLGLMTKFRFKQNVNSQEMIDLLPWLKQNGGRLPKNPLEYKEFENLKDDIIITDNKHRVKMVYNLLPREQKELAKKNKPFSEKALAIHKMGLIKDFGRKVSAQKTKEDLINYMTEFINKNSESITMDKIIDKLRGLKTQVLINDPDSGILMAEIFDYNASKSLGSSDWCISTKNQYWVQYTSGTRRQFFMWDFSLEKTNDLFLIGFTSNEMGQITHIHDKYDVSLKGDVPSKIKESLEKVNISITPFEYKERLLKDIEEANIDLINIDNNERYKNFLFMKVDKEQFNKVKSVNWSDPFPWTSVDKHEIDFNCYVLYDFNKSLTDNDFCHYYLMSDDGEMVLIEIYDNNNIKSVMSMNNSTKKMKGVTPSNRMVYDLWKSGMAKARDLQEKYEDRKHEYLDKVRSYISGNSKLSSYEMEKIEFINTSNDEGSYGDTWLFKLEDSSSNFKTEIIDSWDPMRHGRIHKFNYYVIVNCDEPYRSRDFIRMVKASDDEIIIKFNDKEDVKIKFDENTLPEDIKDLVSNGYIKLKTQKEYNLEVQEAKREVFEKSNDEYLDETVNDKGRALYEFLVEEDEIEDEEREDYDTNEDGQYDWDNRHQKYLIPSSGNYDLQDFEVFNLTELINGHSSKSWSIADDDEMDKAGKEAALSYIEEHGVASLNNFDITDHMNVESFASDYKNDSYYYDDMIREDPESYGIKKSMVDGVSEKIESKTEERDDLESKISEKQSDLEKMGLKLSNFDEYINNKIDRISEIIEDDLDKNNPDHVIRVKKLKKIEENLRNKLKLTTEKVNIQISELEEEISELEENFEEIDNLIDEMEDEDNDEYWEVSESDIEEKVEDMQEENEREITNDPMDYMENMGYDKDQINKSFKNYIDEDSVAEWMVSMDGRQHNLSSYDGKEHEFTAESGETYFIIRTG